MEREHGGSEQHTARLIRCAQSAGVARATHDAAHARHYGVDTDTDGDDDNAELDGGENGDAADDEQELQSEEILRAARTRLLETVARPPTNDAAPTASRPTAEGDAASYGTRGGSRDPTHVVLSGAETVRPGLAPVSVLDAPPIVAQRRVSDGAVGDRQQAAKSTPVATGELELARREIEKLNSHLLDHRCSRRSAARATRSRNTSASDASGRRAARLRGAAARNSNREPRRH